MENQIDLKSKSILELKAIAYDLGIMTNEYRNMLNIVNQEIIERSKIENNKVNETPVQVKSEPKAEESKLKKVD